MYLRRKEMPIEKHILQRLKTNDNTLRELGLSGRNLTAIDMQELAKALAQNTNLTTLNVYDNQIGDEGAQALTYNKSLAQLVVIGNPMGEEWQEKLNSRIEDNKKQLVLRKHFHWGNGMAFFTPDN